MRIIVIALYAFFFVSTCFVNWWAFKQEHRRPSFSRDNERLGLAYLAAIIALIAAFFLSLNLHVRLLKDCAILVGCVAYDLALRWYFQGREVYRICRHHRGLSRDRAIVRVRLRSKGVFLRRKSSEISPY